MQPKITARPRWIDGFQSRPHCQLKYWSHMPIWANNVACRSVTGGLPYCSRFSTALSASQVVGSPSLMGG